MNRHISLIGSHNKPRSSISHGKPNRKHRDSVSMSVRSFESHASKVKRRINEQLLDPDVAISIKNIIERLLSLYNQQKDLCDVSSKQALAKISGKQFTASSNLVEIVASYNSFMNNCQIALSSSMILSSALESLTILWAAHSNYKQEVTASVNNNKELSTTCTSLSQELIDLEAKKWSLVDEVAFYKDIWTIYNVDQDEIYSTFEDEIWGMLLTMPASASIPIQLIEIDIFLREDTTSEIESQIKNYLKDGRTDEYIGLVVLNIGKRCLYLGAHDVALRIIKKATMILKKFLDVRSIKSNLLPFAEAFVLRAEKKVSDAAKLLKAVALNIAEIDFESTNEKAYVSFYVGYFLLKWKEIDSGFEILEQSLKLFKGSLPQSEVLWTKYVNMTARFYNEFEKPDVAFGHLTTVLDYFHEKIHGPITAFSKPIYMIAGESKHVSRASELLMGTLSSQMGFLPQMVMTTVRELVVTFAILRNMNAVKVVEKYMEDNSAAHRDLVCNEMDETDDQWMLNQLKNRSRRSVLLSKKKGKQ